MQLLLNGQAIALPGPPGAHTVAHLLAQQGLAGRRVAVEVNGAIVPRSAHAVHALHEDDRVEIVHALGGG